MKSYLIACLIISCVALNAQVKFSGNIKNKLNQEVLPGAVVYFPDLKTGAVAGANGSFEVKNLPAIKTLVQVRLIGYKSLIKTIDLSTQQQMDFELEESVIEENEVVVTGVSKATEVKKNPAPMVFIDSEYLEENAGTNIIDAISKVPGVNAISTGPNVSKPVIRGLGFNRILTLFDGIRQEGQQWGEEHGIEIDQFLIDRIEVVKGPSSLIYGSDALGGVVNLLPQNPVPVGVVKGGLIMNYQTNNKLRASSLSFAGNNGGMIWGIRLSAKDAVDFMNRQDGRVFNTGYREKNLFLSAGINRKWGYSHFSYTMYDNSQEIPDGSRDSASRKFTKQITEDDLTRPVVQDSELSSYTINNIHQRIEHKRISSTSNLILGESRLALKLGFQNSVRSEYTHPESPSTPGLYLMMNTGTYDLKFYLPELKRWESTIGFNGMYQVNDPHKGTSFVIPGYQLFDIAPFIYLKRDFKKLNVAFGGRYDKRFFDSGELYTITDPASGFDKRTTDTSGAEQRFKSSKNSFSGFSGSFGLAYQISEPIVIKANIARGYRAPNISELAAAGVHPGSGYQQLGNSDFKPEFNLQYDLGVFFDSEHISASAEVFNNVIRNYIFNQKLQSLAGGDSVFTRSGNDYPVFKFRQTTAQLYGAEARIDIHPHPLDWLHFENVVSFVNGNNLGGNGVAIGDDNRFLPFIPPLHTNSELRAEFRKGKGVFSGIFLKFGFQYFAAQNRVHLANETETKTPGYGLIDAGLGTDVTSKKGRTLFSFSFAVNNLGDVVYQSHMSRLKYFDDYPVNHTGRSGIYSMGRNFSFKLTIPVTVRKG